MRYDVGANAGSGLIVVRGHLLIQVHRLIAHDVSDPDLKAASCTLLGRRKT